MRVAVVRASPFSLLPQPRSVIEKGVRYFGSVPLYGSIAFNPKRIVRMYELNLAETERIPVECGWFRLSGKWVFGP